MTTEPMTATQALARAIQLRDQWRNGNEVQVLVDLARGPRALAVAFGVLVGGGQGFNPEAGAQFLELLAQTEDQARLLEGAQ